MTEPEFPDRDEEIEASKKRRASHRKSSLAVLNEQGFFTEEKNIQEDKTAAHLIVRRYGITADLWPGTGKWIFRLPDQPSGRGVFELIQKFKELRDESQGG